MISDEARICLECKKLRCSRGYCEDFPLRRKTGNPMGRPRLDLTPEERKEARRAYMRDYYRRTHGVDVDEQGNVRRRKGGAE